MTYQDGSLSDCTWFDDESNCRRIEPHPTAKSNTEAWACILYGITVQCCSMEILSVRHRGLRELLERNSARLLRQELATRIRNVLTAPVLAESLEDLRAQGPPGWRIHKLSGDREEDWSISVSGNWRITFKESDGTIERLNLEDYH